MASANQNPEQQARDRINILDVPEWRLFISWEPNAIGYTREQVLSKKEVAIAPLTFLNCSISIRKFLRLTGFINACQVMFSVNARRDSQRSGG